MTICITHDGIAIKNLTMNELGVLAVAVNNAMEEVKDKDPLHFETLRKIHATFQKIGT